MSLLENEFNIELIQADGFDPDDFIASIKVYGDVHGSRAGVQGAGDLGVFEPDIDRLRGGINLHHGGAG